MDKAKVDTTYVGQSFDEYLKENLSAEEIKVIEAKAQFLLELTNLRKESHLTQTELGNRIGVTQSTVAKIEKGMITPSFDNLFRLLGSMGKTIRITSL